MYWLLSLLVLLATCAIGCSGSEPLATEAPLSPDATEADLVRALALNGFSAETGVYRQFPLLDGPGRELRVRAAGAGHAFSYAGTLHVHRFPTPEDAEAALDHLRPTFDAAPPRVYGSGRLVVVYFGAGTDLPDTLYRLLGPPL